ncbi:UNVERIFIED_CONTAM: hypothetical protein FKN15_006004 [Acipenser sinensis]
MTDPEEGGFIMSHRTHLCLTAVTLVVLLIAACTLGIVLSQVTMGNPMLFSKVSIQSPVFAPDFDDMEQTAFTL